MGTQKCGTSAVWGRDMVVVKGGGKREQNRHLSRWEVISKVLNL